MRKPHDGSERVTRRNGLRLMGSVGGKGNKRRELVGFVLLVYGILIREVLLRGILSPTVNMEGALI